MSERDKVISAGSLVMISYGLSQLIRLGANLIVTRLLAPEMFGVMAMVTVLMHGITMFSDVGLTDYVIRHKDYKNSHVLNAVWTIQVIRGWLVFILLIGLSFMMSLWQTKYAASSGVYGDESLPIMIGVVSISAIFSGYNSLAPAVLTRELKRGRLELIRLLAQTSGAVTMIGWAYLYPTIWALASAGVVSSAVTLLLSYTMFNFRHRLEWNRERVLDVFNFGKWIFIASAITYLAQQGDKLFFGAKITPAELGVLSIAVMLAGFSTAMIDQITGKVWLPVFSRKSNDVKSLKSNFNKIRLGQDSLVSLFTLIFGIWSPHLIDILYDSRYTEVSRMLQLLLLSSFAMSVASTNKVLLVSLGETKVQMQVMFFKVLSLIVLLPISFNLYGITGGLLAVVISSYVGIIPQYIKMYSVGMLDFWKEIRIILPALLLYSWLIFGKDFAYFN
ncbi:hypothetical protein A9Q78_10500 [Methylophaga sp. 41_12_T18]|nr:hypothetical protein A9Q78_10500 [Methylophaga sp. 41_12_T18]